MKIPLLLVALSLGACSGASAGSASNRGARAAPQPAAAPAPAAKGDDPEAAEHYGEAMSELGHRFELAGRAANANRFDLAGYEVGEMYEVIDDDLAHASPPREGDPKKVAALLEELRGRRLPDLSRTAVQKDAQGFTASFAETARTCNACHAATKHGFLQIPEEPGREVPRLDPLPAPPVPQ